MNGEWTVRQGLFCLLGSTGLTLMLSLGGYWQWTNYKQSRIEDEKHRIGWIVQTGPAKEGLKTVYLAELIGLAADLPMSLYVFDCKAAEKKLLASPVIKKARVERLPPNGLYIDYEVRKPVALLADYQNIAIDQEGYIFPFLPFFTPKEIPEIYLGLPPFGSAEDPLGRRGGQWQAPVKNSFFHLGLECLRLLEEMPWKENFRVKRIDVSNAFAPSLGSREIVLFTEETMVFREKEKEIYCVFPKILRMAPKEIEKQLRNFFVLRRNMEEDYRKQCAHVSSSSRFSPRIIDLRIPQLAFVENQH